MRGILARWTSRITAWAGRVLTPLTHRLRPRWESLPPLARFLLSPVIGIAAAIAILVLLGPYLCAAMGAGCFWAVGATNTFILFLGSAGLGLFIGFFVGWGRASRIPTVSLPLLVYVEGLRGIPRLAIVLMAVVIFPRLGVGINWAVLWGILALGVSSGAYQGEVFRSGFQSIPRPQIEAATSLGMTYWQTMQHVTLPQVVRTILPPLGNEWIIVLKDTSLLIVLPAFVSLRVPDVFELTRVAETVQRATLDVTLWPLIFLGAAAVYLAMTIVISKTIQFLEERFQVPGLGVVVG